MTPDEIAAQFTHSDGAYRFARWARPIAPVVFGVEDRTLATIKGAIEAMVAACGHRMAETDAEQGANLFLFFLKDWSEISAVPDLEGLVPGIGAQASRLAAQGAQQYRQFRFEADGAIRACFVFLDMGGAMADMPADALALSLAVQTMALWSEQAFGTRGPLMAGPQGALIRPEVAALLRAAYDPALPVAADDPAHALRLFARLR